MKAVVLSGGTGTRLSPLTDSIAKQLLPVANRPVLYHVMDRIKDAGITDVGVIVSPETGPYVEPALGDGSRWDVHITCIMQPEPLGMAHAVIIARDFLGDSPFLVFLGDNLVQDNIKGFVDEFNSSGADALVLLKEVANPRLFGVAELDSSGRIRSLVEKPAKPKSNLALVGVFMFTPEIHRAISRIKPSRRGELELTDAIQGLLDAGKGVRSRILAGWWFDAGTRESLLEANRALLDSLPEYNINGEIDSESRITGVVEIGAGTYLINSTVRGPVSIAGRCRITNSVIGPYASIATGTMIEKSLVENSVIMDDCSISNVSHIDDSIIGRNAVITGQANDFTVNGLIIANDAKIR